MRSRRELLEVTPVFTSDGVCQSINQFVKFLCGQPFAQFGKCGLNLLNPFLNRILRQPPLLKLLLNIFSQCVKIICR